ncbi:MAG: multicopper oxidase domain-containing protein [Flavipsychrobacter sp.]|nr:multicopper oxidase domain-containing protein [Flavipsychrobacter sp.]
MRKIFIIVFLLLAQIAKSQNQLSIPDTLSGTSFDLTVHQDSVQFYPGSITHTYGINGNSYGGPTLIINKGDNISLNVHNNMGDTTTMHWHGLHVAPKNDGGPYSMVMSGMSWNPRFIVRNSAATYWYHPHMMAKTAEQAIKGDIGLIIVRDNAEAVLNLPRHYGVDDFPIIVQSVELNASNQFMPKGMVDSILFVNGTTSPYVSMPSQVVRMRLLNASGERTMNFGCTANKSFYVIGNDDGLLPAPVPAIRIRLSPGERAEVLVDLTGMSGQTIYLKSYASELPTGIQGGPTMVMPAGSPPMNSPLNGIDFNILQINVGAQTATPVTSVPAVLITDTAYLEGSAHTTRTINMTADSLMVMDGPFYFNDSLFNMMRVDYHIPLGNTEIWKLTNQTMVAHPFHIHDVYFYILDRDGNAPPAVERGKKDVVLVQPNETVRFITRFEDFADTTTPYMYHCHILMHEDDGMMGQFVVEKQSNGLPVVNQGNDQLILYPNPVKGLLTIQQRGTSSGHAQVHIYNMLGQCVYKTEHLDRHCQINTAGWSKGVYNLVYTNEGQRLSRNFIVN